jgi:hypothetical protein
MERTANDLAGGMMSDLANGATPMPTPQEHHRITARLLDLNAAYKAAVAAQAPQSPPASREGAERRD